MFGVVPFVHKGHRVLQRRAVLLPDVVGETVRMGGVGQYAPLHEVHLHTPASIRCWCPLLGLHGGWVGKYIWSTGRARSEKRGGSETSAHDKAH